MYKVFLNVSKEKLVFNVDTGYLPPNKAEALVFNLMEKYSNNKREDFWFSRPKDQQGTQIENIPGYSEVIIDADEHHKDIQNDMIVFLKNGKEVSAYSCSVFVGYEMID